MDLNAESEQFFQCPYCFETISMLIEPQNELQEYIEDCEVCCRPIRLQVTTSELGEIKVEAGKSQ